LSFSIFPLFIFCYLWELFTAHIFNLNPVSIDSVAPESAHIDIQKGNPFNTSICTDSGTIDSIETGI